MGFVLRHIVGDRGDDLHQNVSVVPKNHVGFLKQAAVKAKSGASSTALKRRLTFCLV